MGSRNGPLSGWGHSVELDGAATRRLVRALEAGVPIAALECRFGHDATTLLRAARGAGWDGTRGTAASFSPMPGSPMSCPSPDRWFE